MLASLCLFCIASENRFIATSTMDSSEDVKIDDYGLFAYSEKVVLVVWLMEGLFGVDYNASFRV